MLRQTLARKPRAKVLSVACGPCCDVRSILAEVASTDGSFVFNDSDEDAIVYARSHFPPHVDQRCTWVGGNVFNRLRRLAELGPYDLIMAGGLFDYLSDRQCSWLVGHLVQMMAPESKLFFTNIASDNPFRLCMEHIACWKLIARSENDIGRCLVPTGNRCRFGSIAMRPDWRS